MARPAGMSSDEDASDSDEGYWRDFDWPAPLPQMAARPDVEYISLADELLKSVSANKLEDMATLLTESKYSVDWIFATNTALISAAQKGYYSMCECILQHIKYIDQLEYIYTPLMAAASSQADEHELLKCIDLFVNHGADVNNVDSFKTSPLMLAARDGHTSIVKKLVDLGADVNHVDNDGWSALFFAVNKDNRPTILVLIEAGALFDKEDKRGRYPYDIAILKEYNETAELIKPPHVINLLPTKFRIRNADMLTEAKSGFQNHIEDLLQAMELSCYDADFFQQNTKLDEFLSITDEQLKCVGVPFSIHRQTILDDITNFHLHRWTNTSLDLKKREQTLELYDCLSLIANIVRHLYVIRSTICYLKVHHEKALNSFQKSTESIKDCINEVYFMRIRAKKLNALVKEIGDRDQINLPPDLLTKSSKPNLYITFGIILGIPAALFCAHSLKYGTNILIFQRILKLFHL